MIEFHIFGCGFRLHFLFLAALCVVMFTDLRETALLGMIGVAIHEGGHLFMMVLCRVPPKLVVIQPFGVMIYEREDHQRSYGRDGWISLGGPLLNGVAIGIAFLIHFVCSISIQDFLLVNAALGVFNLLPIEDLDGGRALYAFLCIRQTPEWANKVVTVISFLFLIPMAIVGFLLLLQSKYNFSLLLTSIYLMLCVVLKNRWLLHGKA